MQRGVGPEAGGTLLHLPGITAASVTHVSGTVPAECAEPACSAPGGSSGRARPQVPSGQEGTSPGVRTLTGG